MKAPNFVLPYLNEKGTYQLQEDHGKVIILTFWTSWCPDCGADLPRKEKLYQSIDHQKVRMLTINVAGRERSKLAAIQFAKEFLTQPTLIDNGTDIYNLYQSQGVPTTVLIDASGNIHRQFNDQANFLDIVTALGEIIA